MFYLNFALRFTDESPRWLFVRGRKTEAEAVVKKASKWNKSKQLENIEMKNVLNQIDKGYSESRTLKQEMEALVKLFK